MADEVATTNSNTASIKCTCLAAHITPIYNPYHTDVLDDVAKVTDLMHCLFTSLTLVTIRSYHEEKDVKFLEQAQECRYDHDENHQNSKHPNDQTLKSVQEDYSSENQKEGNGDMVKTCAYVNTYSPVSAVFVKYSDNESKRLCDVDPDLLDSIRKGKKLCLACHSCALKSAIKTIHVFDFDVIDSQNIKDTSVLTGQFITAVSHRWFVSEAVEHLKFCSFTCDFTKNEVRKNSANHRYVRNRRRDGSIHTFQKHKIPVKKVIRSYTIMAHAAWPRYKDLVNNEGNNNLLDNDRYDKTSNTLAKEKLQDTQVSIERIPDATSEKSSGLETMQTMDKNQEKGDDISKSISDNVQEESSQISNIHSIVKSGEVYIDEDGVERMNLADSDEDSTTNGSDMSFSYSDRTSDYEQSNSPNLNGLETVTKQDWFPISGQTSIKYIPSVDLAVPTVAETRNRKRHLLRRLFIHYNNVKKYSVNNESDYFYSLCKEDKTGNSWYTAAFYCPAEKSFVHAQGGGGFLADSPDPGKEGMYWYGSNDDAVAAAAYCALVFSGASVDDENDVLDYTSASKTIGEKQTSETSNEQKNNIDYPQLRKSPRFIPSNNVPTNPYYSSKYPMVSANGVATVSNLVLITKQDWHPFPGETEIKYIPSVDLAVPTVAETRNRKRHLLRRLFIHYNNVKKYSVNNESDYFYSLCKEDKTGNSWYTAAFYCPAEKSFVHAQGGGGFLADSPDPGKEGMYWYGSNDDAVAAAAYCALVFSGASVDDENDMLDCGSDLPVLRDDAWLETRLRLRRCEYFPHCRKGIKCSRAHVYIPSPVVDDRPLNESYFWNAYSIPGNFSRSYGRQRILEKFHIIWRTTKGEKRLCTAALECPDTYVIYYAMGRGGKCSEQNIWWYEKEKAAKHAVISVAIDHFVYGKKRLRW